MALAARIGSGAIESGAIGTATDHLRIGLVAVPAWLLLFVHYGLYSSRRITSRSQEFRAIFQSVALGVGLIAVSAYALELQVAPRWPLLTFVCALFFVAVERDATRRTFERLRRRGHMLRRVVIVGANDEGEAIATTLRSTPGLGYDVVGFVDDAVTNRDGIVVLGPTSHTIQVVAETGATGVIIATTAIDLELCNRLARQLVEQGTHVELTSALCDIDPERLLVRPLGEFPVVYLEPVKRRGWRAMAKRVFDIACSGSLLILTIPLLVAIAISIKCESAGPVLFRQRRVGKDGRIFMIYKFRTMTVDAEAQLVELRARNEADGPLFKIREDPRVTRVGRFLRRTSLDELAQLWNVVRNEMSMVGPRPALPSEAAHWDPRLRERLRVKPGLTGKWQTNGRSSASFDMYSRLDLYYVDNWSLATDLGILLNTIPTVLRRNGAY